MSIVRFALRPSLVEEHAINGTIIATFTNARASAFALNWARGLNSLGLKTMVGISQRLGPATEESLRAAGAGLFCADGAQMQRNGQAGRWAEAISLLRAGYHVLLGYWLAAQPAAILCRREARAPDSRLRHAH